MFYYYNTTHPMCPYTHSLPGELPEGAEMPDNATSWAPEILPGCWPVFNASTSKWDYTQDHRKHKDEMGREIEDSGTPYWLPGDTWQTPARYMTEIGPLPGGALLKAPDITLNEAREQAQIRFDIVLSDADRRAARSTQDILARSVEINTATALLTKVSGPAAEELRAMLDDLKRAQLEDEDILVGIRRVAEWNRTEKSRVLASDDIDEVINAKPWEPWQ